VHQSGFAVQADCRSDASLAPPQQLSVPPGWRLIVSSRGNAQSTVRLKHPPAYESHDRSPRGSQPQPRPRGRWPSLPKTSTQEREPHSRLSFSFEFPAFGTNRTSSLGNSGGLLRSSILTRLGPSDGTTPVFLMRDCNSVELSLAVAFQHIDGLPAVTFGRPNRRCGWAIPAQSETHAPPRR